VVITWHDMIDGIGVWTSADVADVLIPPEYYAPTGTPVFWKTCSSSASLPMNLMF